MYIYIYIYIYVHIAVATAFELTLMCKRILMFIIAYVQTNGMYAFRIQLPCEHAFINEMHHTLCAPMCATYACMWVCISACMLTYMYAMM